MDTTTPTSVVLNKAADLIEERGWGTGTATWDADENAGVCIEGALLAALGMRVLGHNAKYDEDGAVFRHTFEACPAYRAVRAYLASESEWLWAWNDEFDPARGGFLRTQTEVVSVLRAAALIEAAKENSSAQVPAEVVA